MRDKTYKQTTKEGSMKAQVRQSASPSSTWKTEQSTAAKLLSLQQTHGNRYVQGLLLQAGLGKKCSCSGSSSQTGECADCATKRQPRLQTRLMSQPKPVSRQRVREVFSQPDIPTNSPHAAFATRLGYDNPGGQNFASVQRADQKSVAGSARPNARAALFNSLGSTMEDSGELLGPRFVSKSCPGPKLIADREIVRYSSTPLTAMLSDTGTAGTDDAELLAQQDAGMPGPDAGVPAPSCAYRITYANVQQQNCTGGRCGKSYVYDVTRVSATGSGCPATLNGVTLTETATNNHGCVSGNVQTGAGCTIGAAGVVPPGCTDTYQLCGNAASFPATGCTEVVTQHIFVGGVLAETHTITFTITKSAGNCTGTVSRS